MADALPAKLRQAEITRYVNRANQLRQIKPAITYWCEYWVVKQILAKNLHNADEECLNYTTSLMDRLEQTKSEYANDDAIMDDTAGQVYVEQFAQETFDRADRVLRANKVTRQTADTFDAAATFFSLIQIWSQLDEETHQKIKFAKWNATRILKAIREGKDPNESNPKREEGDPAVLTGLDPNDTEVQRFADPSSAMIPRSVSVEDVPESNVPPPSVSPIVPDHRPPQPAFSPRHGDITPPPPPAKGYFDPPPQQPSPLSPPFHSPNVPAPEVSPQLPPVVPHPSTLSQPHVPTMPSSYGPGEPYSVQQPYPVQQPQPAQQPQPPQWTSPAAIHPQQPASPWAAPSISLNHFTPQGQTPPVGMQHQLPPQRPSAPPMWQPPPPTTQQNIPEAQKHAKWAVSALNFDDVPTAIKELQIALAALGVRQ